MALLKKKQDPYGNGGIEYFKIIETNINWLDKTCHITLAGYVNQKARDEGKQPIESESFNWANEEFPFDLEKLNLKDENTVKVAYEKIKESKIEEGKETNFFVDALNV
jgi:hypothetical protein